MISKEPVLTRSPAGIVAVREVLLPNVVVRGVVPQYTTAPFTKLVPATDIDISELPAVAELGLRLVIVGLGAFTVNVAGPEVPLSGFLTVIEKEPVAVRSVEGTVAVSEVLLPKVVVNAVLPQYTIAPFT